MIFSQKPLDLCGTVTIETPRLTLRRLTLADAASMHKNWAADVEVYRFMTSRRMPEYTDVCDFIAAKLEGYFQRDVFYWGVFEKASGECIGMTTLTEVLPHAKTANLAYSLGQNWWGKGLAHEAAAAVLDFAFGRVGFRKIYGCHFVGNERSGYVLAACGMRHMGRSQTAVPHHGEYLRFESYEITAKEYAKFVAKK